MTISECIELSHCPACTCENDTNAILGTFGRLTWLRCRDCGMDYKIDYREVA